MSKIYD